MLLIYLRILLSLQGYDFDQNYHRCHEQWIVTYFDMSLMNEIQIGIDREEYFLQENLALD